MKDVISVEGYSLNDLSQLSEKQSMALEDSLMICERYRNNPRATEISHSIDLTLEHVLQHPQEEYSIFEADLLTTIERMRPPFPPVPLNSQRIKGQELITVSGLSASIANNLSEYCRPQRLWIEK